MSSKYLFGRASDAQILRLMEELVRIFTVSSATARIGDLGSITIEKNAEGNTSESDEGLRPLLGESTYLITDMAWTAGKSHRVSYWRSKKWALNPHNNQEHVVHPDNPYVDALEVQAATENAPAVLRPVNQFLDMAPPVVGGPGAAGPLEQAQAILNRVSSSVATLVEHTAERQKDLDQTRTSLAREADEAIKAARAEAQEQVQAHRREFEQKELQLAEREKGLDDRANTHVRREFAAQMASLSDTRLASNLLTKSERSFQIPVLIALLAVAGLSWLIATELASLEAYGSNASVILAEAKTAAEQKSAMLQNIDRQILYGQIRVGLQSLGVAALVWFALRFASARYKVVSSWERDLHKFRLDTERAGFLVEGDLEARKVNDVGLPDVLLESFSRNLFTGHDGQPTGNANEELGGTLSTLLGQAARVKVGPDGVNVEVEGRGIRRAKKLLEQDVA